MELGRPDIIKTPRYRDVEFSFTGFGEFGSIKNNPSMEMVGEIREVLKLEDMRVVYAEVLRVAALDSYYSVRNLHQALKIRQAEYPEFKQVLIHLGVNSNATEINLESVAKNNMKFNIPDMRGWQPAQGQINKQLPEEHELASTLPVQQIKDSVSSTRLKISRDAGGYICNYTYYLSLSESLISKISCIFIHVPNFVTVPKVIQFNILKEICAKLRKYYT